MWESFQSAWEENGDRLLMRLGEHIFLTFASTALAAFIGIILALLVFRSPRWRGPLLVAVNLVQTIPSLALLALLLAIFQRIGSLPALIALTLYALLPIIRGTLTGLEQAPPHLIEAARGIGMTSRQRLLMVRLPLAMPVIVAGVRVAANIGVGVATIAAFVGAGGLGQFINRGLFLNDTRLILMGAIPAALLALLIDRMIAGIEYVWFAQGWRSGSSGKKASRFTRWLFTLMPCLLFLFGVYEVMGGYTPGKRQDKIVIGSKNFTEQIILGEIAAQWIEQRTHLPVERRFGLGGSQILHQAITHGEIDLYPEYTGTALATVLKKDNVPREKVFSLIRDVYTRDYKLRVLNPLGFDNGYVMLMRKDMADRLGIALLSDLKEKGSRLRAGVDFEFAERKDGFRGLQDRYGITFSDVKDIDPNLIYSVLRKGQVDIISGYATDGRIAAFDFKALKDDLSFFPPYQAVYVMRESKITSHPKVLSALNELSRTIDDDLMRRMNFEVDYYHKAPAEVAHAFLERLAMERGPTGSSQTEPKQ